MLFVRMRAIREARHASEGKMVSVITLAKYILLALFGITCQSERNVQLESVYYEVFHR